MSHKKHYRKPCPRPPKGVRCPLCGAAWVCTQPSRPKAAIPAESSAHNDKHTQS